MRPRGPLLSLKIRKVSPPHEFCLSRTFCPPFLYSYPHFYSSCPSFFVVIVAGDSCVTHFLLNSFATQLQATFHLDALILRTHTHTHTHTQIATASPYFVPSSPGKSEKLLLPLRVEVTLCFAFPCLGYLIQFGKRHLQIP